MVTRSARAATLLPPVKWTVGAAAFGDFGVDDLRGREAMLEAAGGDRQCPVSRCRLN